MSVRSLTLAALLSGTAMISACAVGPAPSSGILPASASAGLVDAAHVEETGAVTVAETRDDWWRLYDDPRLDILIGQAFQENNQLEAAAANLEAVRASLSEGRAGRLPTTGLSATGQRARASAATVPGSGGASQDDTDLYSVGLDVSYEVDLFGGVEAGIRAAGADAQAAAANLDGVRVSVAAETARAYADVCSANASIRVAEQTIDLQAQTARLTQTLLEGGSGTGLDVARANSALASVRASLPSLMAQRDAALFRLATLTGRTPAEVLEDAAQCARPPQLSQPIPIGDGAMLLARRPDVRQAERNLAAAGYRVNVAMASLYPSIRLGGSLGSTALEAGNLGRDGNLTFSLGPLISWSFPNVVGARARVDRADALASAALANFDQTVLAALEETSTALSAYGNELDRRLALTQARDEAETAVRLSRLRFNAGADSFLAVLDAERTLAASEASLAASDARVTTLQIALFKALAGGWQGVGT